MVVVPATGSVSPALVELVGGYADAQCGIEDDWILCVGQGDSADLAQSMLEKLAEVGRPRLELGGGCGDYLHPGQAGGREVV